MFLSVCILGLNEYSKKVVAEYKKLNGYGDKFRVHCIHVTDLSSHLNDITTREYTVIGSNESSPIQALKDGTEMDDDLMVPITVDDDWLLQSDGHDTVLLASEEYQSLYDSLKEKGYLALSCVEYREDEVVELFKSTINKRIPVL